MMSLFGEGFTMMSLFGEGFAMMSLFEVVNRSWRTLDKTLVRLLLKSHLDSMRIFF
jgi:hypothetical protein